MPIQSLTGKNLISKGNSMFVIHSDLRGSATTDMQGVESSVLWSSSEDRQSLLCGGSVLSSESISSASNENKTKQISKSSNQWGKNKISKQLLNNFLTNLLS